MRMRLLLGLLPIFFMTNSICRGGTLSPGETLIATFTASPNTSDMLLFFFPDPITITGDPIITTDLFNGTVFLGAYVAAPYYNSTVSQYHPVGFYYLAWFEGPSSPFSDSNPTVVDLTSVQNGTINGLVEITASGGSISDTFNDFADNLALWDPQSAGSDGYMIHTDLTRTSQTLTTPEPSTAVLSALTILYIVWAKRRDAGKRSSIWYGKRRSADLL